MDDPPPLSRTHLISLPPTQPPAKPPLPVYHNFASLTFWEKRGGCGSTTILIPSTTVAHTNNPNIIIIINHMLSRHTCWWWGMGGKYRNLLVLCRLVLCSVGVVLG